MLILSDNPLITKNKEQEQNNSFLYTTNMRKRHHIFKCKKLFWVEKIFKKTFKQGFAYHLGSLLTGEFAVNRGLILRFIT